MKTIFLISFFLGILYIFSDAFEETKVQRSEEIKAHTLNDMTERHNAAVVVALINNAENILKDAKKYASIPIRVPAPYFYKPVDCFDVMHDDPLAKNGIYKIWPCNRLSTGPIEVYCDMEDEGGAWTVIQRRGDFDSGKDYFFRDWLTYKKGFGSLLKDFWLGNDNIFALTNQKINVVKFTLTDWEGNQTYATYDEFWIDDELNKYKVHVQGYRGTAGDSFVITNGDPFTTRDEDNDSAGKNCAEVYKGAWWYGSCHESNLNGLYLKGPHESFADGVNWKDFRGYNYSLKDTVIKIRPRDFSKTINLSNDSLHGASMTKTEIVSPNVPRK